MSLRQSLRVDNATIQGILDGLDAQDQRPAAAADQDERYPYRIPALHVEFEQTPGESTQYVVPGRRISRDGVSFLVGQLVYPETPCRIDLITTHNHWQSVHGTIVGCRYVAGTASIYEADVRFQEPIDLALFVARALQVRVLLADDSRTSRDYLTHMLKAVNADVTTCENGQQALDLALAEQFDVILLDMDMPVMDGFEAVRRLRAHNVTPPIVAITGLTAPEDREACFAAGCDDYLAKPPSPEAISDLANRLRPEPLTSSLVNMTPEMTRLVDEFVQTVRQQAREIQEAFAADDVETVQREVRMLKGEAPTCGFEPIGAAAEDVEHALRDKLPKGEIQVRLGKLVRLCCVARQSPTHPRPS